MAHIKVGSIIHWLADNSSPESGPGEPDLMSGTVDSVEIVNCKPVYITCEGGERIHKSWLCDENGNKLK